MMYRGNEMVVPCWNPLESLWEPQNLASQMEMTTITRMRRVILQVTVLVRPQQEILVLVERRQTTRSVTLPVTVLVRPPQETLVLVARRQTTRSVTLLVTVLVRPPQEILVLVARR